MGCCMMCLGDAMQGKHAGMLLTKRLVHHPIQSPCRKIFNHLHTVVCNPAILEPGLLCVVGLVNNPTSSRHVKPLDVLLVLSIGWVKQTTIWSLPKLTVRIDCFRAPRDVVVLIVTVSRFVENWGQESTKTISQEIRCNPSCAFTHVSPFQLQCNPLEETAVEVW